MRTDILSAHLRAMAAARAHALDQVRLRADVFGAGRAVEVPGSRLGTLWRTLPITPIVCVDVMRRTLAPAIRGVVSGTSALRGN